MESVIALNYSNPYHPTSYGSINTVYKYYKPYASIETIKNALSKVPAYTEKKNVRKVRTHVPIYVFFKRELFQMDLIDISYISKSNYGVKYLLTVIDSATRFAFVIPLKNKSGSHVAKKFEAFLDQLDIKPRRILSDYGGEFVASQMKSLLARHNIVQTFPRRKNGHAPTIERFNQTIQRLVYKYMKTSGSNRYIDHLPNIVSTYNNRSHSSISPFSPQEAEKEENRSALIRRLMKNYSKAFRKGRRVKNDLKEGARVLVSSPKKAFHKGYKDQFGKETYIIHSIDESKNVPLYSLKDEDDGSMLRGSFYREEIQKVGKIEDLPALPPHRVVKTRNTGKKKDLYVEWKELPKKLSMWIPENMFKKKISASK